MKALVLEEYGRFEFKEMPLPEIGPGDVLVRIMACAVCGSDVHGMDGSTGRRRPPIIMGHEAAGIIEQVGSDVRGFAAGDRVTFDSTIYCGECPHCQCGQINLCGNRRVLGVSCEEYRMDGAFAEFASIPSRVLYKLPDSVTFRQAAMIEPLAVACHAVSLARITSGAAVVVGCGTIGLMTAQLLRAEGFSPVIVSDVAEEKLELAASLGFEHRLNSSVEKLADAVLALTGGEGAAISIDAVGISASVMDAISSLRKGGECVLVGNIQPSVTIPLQQVVTKQLTLFGSCASAGEYPQCLSLIAEGKVDVDRLISKSVPLSKGNEWIQRLYRREAGLYKVVLLPGEEES
ncbi:MAG: zinc-dependent alcohol dehydrogenase [Christensenellales bacterium]|jgi:L-iditol 2-dehydrogenase